MESWFLFCCFVFICGVCFPQYPKYPKNHISTYDVYNILCVCTVYGCMTCSLCYYILLVLLLLLIYCMWVLLRSILSYLVMLFWPRESHFKACGEGLWYDWLPNQVQTLSTSTSFNFIQLYQAHSTSFNFTTSTSFNFIQLHSTSMWVVSNKIE